MPTLFHEKVLTAVVNQASITHYSDPAFDRMLGEAEKYLVEVVATNVIGETALLTVTLETSNDGVTWFLRGTLIDAVDVLGGAVRWGAEPWNTGDTDCPPMNGCYARFGCTLTGMGPYGNLELYVEGRDGA